MWFSLPKKLVSQYFRPYNECTCHWCLAVRSHCNHAAVHSSLMPPPFATTSNLSLFTAHSGRPRRCCQAHQLLFRQARRLLLCYACQNPLQSLSPSKVERSQSLGPIMKWLPHMCPSQYWWFMRACLGIQGLLPNATQYLTQSPAFPHLRWSHPVLLHLPRLRWFQPVPRCQSAPRVHPVRARNETSSITCVAVHNFSLTRLLPYYCGYWNHSLFKHFHIVM